jgi:hypothetical protein
MKNNFKNYDSSMTVLKEIYYREEFQSLLSEQKINNFDINMKMT